MKLLWVQMSMQKTKLFDTKQIQLEEAWRFEEHLKDREERLENLRYDLDKANKEVGSDCLLESWKYRTIHRFAEKNSTLEPWKKI
mgnify:CR=1 FL=1